VKTFVYEVELACTVPDGFMQLHNPVVFQKVSKPFLHFTAVTPEQFPTHYVSGESYVVSVSALGLIPLGKQEINPVSSLDEESATFRDNGRGLSGTLGKVSKFQHTMTLTPQTARTSVLRDELSWDAGWMTGLMGIGFRVFWLWRHLVMKRLSKNW
jgi:hypothetical protein